MFILNQKVSIAGDILRELRDENLQKDRRRFRENLSKIGFLLGYELSKSLSFSSTEVQTPLGKAVENTCDSDLVLVCLLRASLPFYQGFLQCFPEAESAFIGVKRLENKITEVEIDLGYLATADFHQKELVICDPMLASGKSMYNSINELLKLGTPSKIHIASAFAAPDGINFLKTNLSLSFDLWLGSLEEGLNKKSFIVPGLGDAGDLAFGEKI